MSTCHVSGAWVAALLAAAGCGSGAGSAGGGTQTGSPVTTSTAPPGPVSIQGFTHASDGSVLPGVEVCADADVGTPDGGACATSTGDGSFALHGLPPDTALTLWFTKDAYLPTVRALDTQAIDVVLPESENALYPVSAPQTLLGVTADPTKGHILFVVMGSGSQPAPAVSVQLSGADADTQPIFVGGAGGTAGTQGGFVNLTPGLYVVRFQAASVTCTADDLYGLPSTEYLDPSSGEAAAVVPVYAGTVTAPVGATCAQ